MKKIFYTGIIACMALSVASCSNDEVAAGASLAEGDAIEFGTYWGRNAEARGANFTNDDLAKKGFGVYAFYTAQDAWKDYTETTPDFMNNTQVTKNGDNWVYAPLKYWPNNTDDKVSFFAYAPYVAGKTWGADSKLAFTVENDVTGQTDLLFCPGLIDQTKPAITSKLTFAFKHALSRIGFEVAYAADQVTVGGTLDANTTIKVNSVTLSDAFYKSGNVQMTAADADAAWTDLSTDKQGFTLKTANFEDVANAVQATYTKLNKDDSYVMVIPQKTTFNVTINYTVTTTDASLGDGKSEITNNITKEVTVNFKVNKAYTLQLLLGMTSVKMSGSYTDWVTDGEEVTVTVNFPENTEFTTDATDHNGNKTDGPEAGGDGDGEDFG